MAKYHKPVTERKELDLILKKWRRVPRERPAGGWIRAMRMALGMSATQLAAMIGATANTVYDYEGSEDKENIRMGSLRRIAEAMHCRLVYAIVPDVSIDRTLSDRRLMVARSALMSLGLQTGQRSGGGNKLLVENIAERLKPGEVWDRVVYLDWIAQCAEQEIQELHDEMTETEEEAAEKTAQKKENREAYEGLRKDLDQYLKIYADLKRRGFLDEPQRPPLIAGTEEEEKPLSTTWAELRASLPRLETTDKTDERGRPRVRVL